MHNKNGALPIKAAERKARQVQSERGKQRTPRACDRCRLKKAKCDGRQRCRTCKTSDSLCTYTARRGRDARNYYSRMRDITDEALQTLYTACHKAGTFPGTTPRTEEDGIVTTNSILEGLGLVGPSVDEHGVPYTLVAKEERDTSPEDTTKLTDVRRRSSYALSPSTLTSQSDSSTCGEKSQVSQPTEELFDLDVHSLPEQARLVPDQDVCEIYPQAALFDAMMHPMDVSLHRPQAVHAMPDFTASFLDFDFFSDPDGLVPLPPQYNYV